MFGQRLEGGEGVSDIDVWRKIISGRGNAQ